MPHTNAPTNIHDALAQATRFERGKTLLAEGYTFEKDKDFDIWAVVKPGTTAAAYWITDGECDCPDRMKGNRCKHEYAVEIVKAEQNKQAALFADDIAACEAAAAAHDASRYNMPLPPVPVVDAEHQRLMNDRGNEMTPPPFCFGQKPDERAVQVLNALRDRIFQERRNAKNLNWSGRVDDLATACTILDEFAVKYISGWFEL